MRQSILQSAPVLGLALLVAACGGEASVDCSEVYRELDACVEKAAGQVGSFTWDQCLPYSEPITITGIHVTDFEHNVFFEGPFADQQDPWQIPNTVTRLDWDRPISKDPDGTKLATVSRVTFVGRRPLCVATVSERWLMVDRVLEEEIVQSRPSVFQ